MVMKCSIETRWRYCNSLMLNLTAKQKSGSRLTGGVVADRDDFLKTYLIL